MEHPLHLRLSTKKSSGRMAWAHEFEITFGNITREGKEKCKTEEKKGGEKKNERKRGEPSGSPVFLSDGNEASLREVSPPW